MEFAEAAIKLMKSPFTSSHCQENFHVTLMVVSRPKTSQGDLGGPCKGYSTRQFEAKVERP
jgi:hypothetical protein